MRIQITRTWEVPDLPQATLQAGQVFNVSPRLAMYLLALHCAQPLTHVDDRIAADDQNPRRRHGLVSAPRLEEC